MQDLRKEFKVSDDNRQPMTVSPHLPENLRLATKYSVDASIYFTVDDLAVIDEIEVELFNPNNPNICFRENLQPLGDDSCYLDIIWALNADSPAAAEGYVKANLEKVIPVPPGLRFDRVEVGNDGFSVYDNEKEDWLFW